LLLTADFPLTVEQEFYDFLRQDSRESDTKARPTPNFDLSHAGEGSAFPQAIAPKAVRIRSGKRRSRQIFHRVRTFCGIFFTQIHRGGAEDFPRAHTQQTENPPVGSKNDFVLLAASGRHG
jgi:hypothetical protein